MTFPGFRETLDFYRKFFGVEPTKQRDGYVKFELDFPPVNFTLNETKKEGYLGIQVNDAGEVDQAENRLNHLGLDPRVPAATISWTPEARLPTTTRDQVRNANVIEGVNEYFIPLRA